MRTHCPAHHLHLRSSPRRAAPPARQTLKTCLRHCRPVYLEIPLNIAAAECEDAQERLDKAPTSSWELGQVHDEEQCATAVEAAAKLIFGARRPAILAGVEVCRVDAQPALRRLARMLRVPIATTRHGEGWPRSTCAPPRRLSSTMARASQAARALRLVAARPPSSARRLRAYSPSNPGAARALIP